MLGLRMQWMVNVLVGLYALSVNARPPSVFTPNIYEGFEMEIQEQGGQHFGDVVTMIQELERILRCSVEYWPSEGVGGPIRDERFIGGGWNLVENFHIWHYGAGGELPPHKYQYVGALWGVLQWLRQWRDEGWVPEATFVTTWTDRRLPTGTETTHGRLGRQILAANVTSYPGDGDEISRPLSGLSARKRQRRDLAAQKCSDQWGGLTSDLPGDGNGTQQSPTGVSQLDVTSLSALPPDPWHTTAHWGVDVEYRAVVSDMVDRQVPVDDMYDVAMDCFMHYAFLCDGGLDGSRDPDGEAEPQPVLCGRPGRPQIYLKGDSDPGVPWPYVSWEQVYHTHFIIFEYLDLYRRYGRRWAPSVRSFRAETFDDQNPERDALTIGWWGMPNGIAPLSDGWSSTGTDTVATERDQNASITAIAR